MKLHDRLLKAHVRKQKTQDRLMLTLVRKMKPRDQLMKLPVRNRKLQDKPHQQRAHKQNLQDPQHPPVRKIHKIISKIVIIIIVLIIQEVHQLIRLHLPITHQVEVGILPQVIREIVIQRQTIQAETLTVLRAVQEAVILRQAEVGAVAHHPAAHHPEIQAVRETVVQAEEDDNII